MIDNENIEVLKAQGSNWRTIYSFIRKLREEEHSFFMLTPKPEDFSAFIIFLNKKPVGFCTWNFLPLNPKYPRISLPDKDKPVLRQLYIIPSERRKGYGTFLFTESRKKFSDSPNLYIESPNKGTTEMLVKLGLIRPADSEGSHGKNGENNVWFIYCG